MSFEYNIFLEGFIVSLGLIIPIGAQNMYILRQGALGNHYLLAALVCAICDTILIVCGALGLGSIIASNSILRQIAVVAGSLFLIYYGCKSFRRAYKVHNSSNSDAINEVAAGRKMVILSGMAFSILNPHAILDATVLIGGLASQHLEFSNRFAFTLGAVTASWVWFFSLGYFGTLLKPLFEKPLTARILDAFVGCLMFFIAFLLLNAEWSLTNPFIN